MDDIMTSTRRGFLRGLAGTPLLRPANRNRRAHHVGTRLYHGPIRLPARVLDLACRSRVYRTTHRHLALRCQIDGLTVLFRAGVAGDCYLGEIVRTESGAIRIHTWSVIADAPALRDLAERHTIALPPALLDAAEQGEDT